MEKKTAEAPKPKTDKEQHIDNMNSHLAKLQSEMQSIQIKFLTTPQMEAKTIVHESKRFQDLSNAAMFTMGMLNGAYPETKPPPLLVPKKEELITKLFN